MSRSLPEWIGKSHDTPAPPRVRLRIFDAYEGRCQCGCNRKILAGEAWDLDHYVSLIRGGGNREFNMRPMLREHHKIKTREDVREKSKTARVRSRHIGIKRTSSRPMPGSRASGWRHKINGEWVRR